MIKLTEEQAQKIADKQDNTYGEPDKITSTVKSAVEAMFGPLWKKEKPDKITSTPPVDWKTRRIGAMNRILKSKNHRAFHEHFAEEHYRVCESKATSKKEYKEENR
jgi:hypothetical protein